MPRPCKCRRILSEPPVNTFRPGGTPCRGLERVILPLDELEALRLADLDGLYQDEAAQRMCISRPTFGRLIESARRKVADALLNGKMLVFQGGVITMAETCKFHCSACGTDFEAPFGTGRPAACPGCGSNSVCRTDADNLGERGRCHRHGAGGPGRGRGRGRQHRGNACRRGGAATNPAGHNPNSTEVQTQ